MSADLAIPKPHPTILSRAVLLCSEAAPESAVQCDSDGRCPVHENGACALWYVPWADAQRAAALAPPQVHHEGVWRVQEGGECGCECQRCYRDDWCVCPDCTFDHDHSHRPAASPESVEQP